MKSHSNYDLIGGDMKNKSIKTGLLATAAIVTLGLGMGYLATTANADPSTSSTTSASSDTAAGASGETSTSSTTGSSTTTTPSTSTSADVTTGATKTSDPSVLAFDMSASGLRVAGMNSDMYFTSQPYGGLSINGLFVQDGYVGRTLDLSNEVKSGTGGLLPTTLHGNMIVNSPNFQLMNGTVTGNVVVNANGFMLIHNGGVNAYSFDSETSHQIGSDGNKAVAGTISTVQPHINGHLYFATQAQLTAFQKNMTAEGWDINSVATLGVSVAPSTTAGLVPGGVVFPQGPVTLQGEKALDTDTEKGSLDNGWLYYNPVQYLNLGNSGGSPSVAATNGVTLPGAQTTDVTTGATAGTTDANAIVNGLGAQGEWIVATTGDVTVNSTTMTYSGSPVYRLEKGKSNVYTASKGEADYLARTGWTSDGVSFYSTTSDSSSKPVYRLTNSKTGDYSYTSSTGEVKWLKTQGWKQEGGVSFYSAKSDNGTPIYLVTDNKTGLHVYTASKGEATYLASTTYTDRGIAFYSEKGTATTTPAKVTVDGMFLNDKGAIGRKLALYSQDDSHIVTAQYTLTVGELVVNTPNFYMSDGTIKGNVFVSESATGFSAQTGKKTDGSVAAATIDGNLTFATQDQLDAYNKLPASQKYVVTGTTSVGTE